MDSAFRVEPIIVLLVEDNPDDVELMRLRLEPHANAGLGGPPITMIHAESVLAAGYALRQRHIDVIILDLTLPDAGGLEALHHLRAIKADVPIIILTGSWDESNALEALRAGAQDYLSKPPPDGPSLRRILRYARERQNLMQELDAAVRQAQRAVAARDRAVGIVSHDLRNPLSTIQACAAALLDPEPPPLSGVRRMAQIIQLSSSWMQQIVQDLLDRTSLDAGRLALDRHPTQVSDVIGAAQAMFTPVAAEGSLDFVVGSADGLPRINADPNRLLQVLSNLLSNAMKFTDAGGQVSLTVEVSNQDALEPSDGASIGGVRFTVGDNGPGISPEDLTHVFDWFWRSQASKRSGAGLGLAIAKGLIEAHRSHLHVRSAPGQGSTFWFTMPAVT